MILVFFFPEVYIFIQILLKSKFRHFVNLWLKSNEDAITLKYIPPNSTYTYHVSHLHPPSHLILYFKFNCYLKL